MKKSRGILSEKERLSLLVIKVAKKCKSLDELANKLKQQQLEPYYRNHKLTGVWLGNRKLRLTTLGVDKSRLKVLTKEQERLNQLKQVQLEKDKKKEIDY